MLNDKFVSAIFCAPTGEYEIYPSRLTDEVFAALKNMGINRIFGYGFDSRAETVERTFELCEKYGIPVLHHAHPLRSDTVRLGLEYLLPRFPAMSGCVFLPGDQPLLTRKTLCCMVSAFCAEPDRKSQIFRLCEPQSGTPGSPVLFGADYFEELRSLPEGRGGGAVVKRHAERVTLFPARHPAELMDADTPDVLAELKLIFQNDSFYR